MIEHLLSPPLRRQHEAGREMTARPPQRSRWLTVFSLVLGVSIAASAHAQGGTEIESAAALMKFVTLPTDVPALLSNIKVALDRGLLLQNSFYGDSVLKHYFGAEDVRLFPSSIDYQVSGTIEEFKLNVPHLIVNGTSYSGIAFYFQKRAHADSSSCAAAIQLYAKVEMATDFETVVSIFGPHWKMVPWLDRPVSSHPSSQPATRPYGNDRISYSVRTAVTSWAAYFDFKYNATIDRATFCAERPSK